MKEIDLTPPTERRGDSALLRWAIRGVFLLCMMLLSTVIMSEPRMANQTKALTSQVNALLASEAKGETSAPGEERTRPEVRQMPSNQVPVRRLTD
jgi:hypothetical protein